MINNKKKYLEPVADIIEFECEDVITTSALLEFTDMPNYTKTQNQVKWSDIYK